MPRSNEASNLVIPAPPDKMAWRHFGDGYAGKIVSARLQGFYASNGDYRDVAVDANGQLMLGSDVAVTIGTVDQGAAGAAAWPVSLAAETTKVLGVSRSADGSGNLLTSTSQALDVNLKSGAIPAGVAEIGNVKNSGTFAVQAALNAETTKVLGVTRSADGSGNLLTSTASALDVNLKSGAIPAGSNVIGHVIADTGSTTAVTQATASNLNAQVVGAGASGASVVGNPVQIGAVNRTTQPTISDGQLGELQADVRGNLKVQINAAGTASGIGAATFGDTSAVTNGLNAGAYMQAFNGTNWSRFYDNWNTTTGDTGTKTTGTFNGATQTNFNARGAIITAQIGTVTGAVTTFQTGIQWSYDGGTTWVGLTALGANDTAVASPKTYTWIIYPTNTSQAAGVTPANLAPASGPTQLNVINAALPRTWRWTMSLTVATSLVLTSVNVNYIL